jgi:hypothetical protein
LKEAIRFCDALGVERRGGRGKPQIFHYATLSSSNRSLWKRRKRRSLLCHPERSRGICSSADLSWKCFPTALRSQLSSRAQRSRGICVGMKKARERRDTILMPDVLRADLFRNHQPARRGLPQHPGQHQRQYHPGYPRKPLCHPFRPAVNARNKPGVTFGLVLLCRKKSSSLLHLTRKSFIS